MSKGPNIGKLNPRECNSWEMMVQRCTNPLATCYSNYGGRGIKVCPRWRCFKNFLADMGQRPPGTTLDRKNTDGDYEPCNCRWATRKEQQNNMRNNQGFCACGLKAVAKGKCNTCYNRIRQQLIGTMREYNGFSETVRNRAQRWLNNEITAGRVKKASCCAGCGQTRGVIDYHAEDYNEPFGPHIYQFPLCFTCHMLLHCRVRSKPAWDRYLKMLRAGFTVAPFFGRSWDSIKAFLEGGNFRTESGPPRPTLIFDTMFLNPPKPRPRPVEKKAAEQVEFGDWGARKNIGLPD
jgi:hypothetical protein